MIPAASGAGGLTRYVVAASLARLADAGGVVAIVLMVTTSGGAGWEAGLLGASIAAPHLLGPFVARRVDLARDGRNVIAIACVLHGVTLAAAVLLFPYVWPIVTAAILVASGLLGPLLTGGISSRLPAIAGPDRRHQRRAQGWDVATYGLAGTIGPTMVAVLSTWSSPTVAGLALAGVTFIAAAFVRLLPFAPAAGSPEEIPRPLRTLGIMLTSGPLRRTLYLTVIVALSVAVLPITAVASTSRLGIPAAGAGILIGAYGLGNLAGSAGVMLRPPRGEADRLHEPPRRSGRSRARRRGTVRYGGARSRGVRPRRHPERVLLRGHPRGARRARTCAGASTGVRLGRSPQDHRGICGHRCRGRPRSRSAPASDRPRRRAHTRSGRRVAHRAPDRTSARARTSLAASGIWRAERERAGGGGSAAVGPRPETGSVHTPTWHACVMGSNRQHAGSLPTTRRRGAVLEEAILTAAWDELAERGWAGFGIEGVSNRVETAKAVVYRRWRNRVELVQEMLDAGHGGSVRRASIVR